MKHLAAVLLVTGVFGLSGCRDRQSVERLTGEVKALEKRLAAVERDIAGVNQAAEADTDTILDQVRARNIQLMDEEGKVRAELKMTDDGAMLCMYDGNRSYRVMLCGYDTRGFMTFFGQDKKDYLVVP